MLRFVVRRTRDAVFSLLGVTVIVFLLARSTGDPTNVLVAIDATADERAAARSQFGLDRPLHIQYWTFIKQVARGDLGESLRLRTDNLELIRDRLPNSFLLAACAIFFASLIGVLIGILAARRPAGIADRGASLLALLGQSVPTFWVGVMLVFVFAISWGLLPASGLRGPSSVVLPAITLGWFSTATMLRVTRSSMREALDSQYVVVARSKGLSERLVVGRHAFRNSIISVLTMGAVQFVLILNGAVVTEKVFNWPGMGSLVVDAAFARDFPLVQAVVLVAATLVVIVNLLVDLAYAALDPRIRVQ